MSAIRGSSLREFVQARSGAVSIAEATAWALVNDFDTSQREVAALHEELGGKVIGRSRLVTADLADALQDRLDDEIEDEEDEGEEAAEDGEDDDEDGDEGDEEEDP
jgi:hypothetical protein